MQRTPPEMTRNARTLRANATDAESKLWQMLRQYRPRFTRQLVVSHYIVDIACRSVKLAIELDGGQHAEHIAADAVRTTYLESRGWQVLRFWNSDVLNNIEGVTEVILNAVVARSSTHPQPLPSREGIRNRE
jgi:very-short-patch-repair endonuclease